MHYKIVKGTPLFKSLDDLRQRMADCNKVAAKLAKKLGGKAWVYDRYYLGGGLSAVEFDEKPAGWKMVGRPWQNLYMPLANKKILWDEISALPTIEKDEMQALLHYKSQSFEDSGNIVWSDLPGIYFRKNAVLIEIRAEASYKPVAGMKEILHSEFIKMEKAK